MKERSRRHLRFLLPCIAGDFVFFGQITDLFFTKIRGAVGVVVWRRPPSSSSVASVVPTPIMAPKSKSKSQSDVGKKEKEKPPFVWTDPLTLTFMQVIKDQTQANGFGQPNNWNAICEEFKTRTGITLDTKSGKNKITQLKAKYTSWTKLRFEVTGAGWDNEKGCVTATDGWWENQKSEKFYIFKHKPPTLEMSDLWDDVFPNMIAVRKHAVAPCMNVDEVPETQTMASEAATEVEDEDISADSLEKQSENDKLYDETQNSEYPCEQDTQQPATQSSKKSTQLLVKDPRDTKTRKKRKKSSPAVNAFQDSCEMVSTAGKEFIANIRNEGSSRCSSQDTTGSGFKESFEELTRLVNAGLIEGNSPLWCYALSELAKKERREIFNILPRDEQKVIWIKYEYERSK